MQWAQIDDWLKTSVLGIVLLGAIGSIVAIFLTKYLWPFVSKLGLKPIRYLHKENMWRYWRSSAAYAHIQADPTNRKLIYYLFRHLARLLIALTSFVTATVVFAIVVASRSEVLLTYGTFVLVTSAFLAAYWVRVEYLDITINFTVEWRLTGLIKDPMPGAPDFSKPGVAEAARKQRETPSVDRKVAAKDDSTP